MTDPCFLRLGEVLEIHSDHIRRHGGHAGIRDLGLLKSAVAMPAAGIADRYLYRDIFEMAAAYLVHIVRDHPFVDGNKRTGAAAAIVFLEINGTGIDTEPSTLVEMVLSVATGQAGVAEVANFLRKSAAH